MAVSLLGILKTVMSRSRAGNPFHSYRQSVAPQDFIHSVNINTAALNLDLDIRVFFIIGDTSRYIRVEKKFSSFYSAGPSKTHFRCVSLACVTEYKVVFYKSSPKVVICFIMMQKNKKLLPPL